MSQLRLLAVVALCVLNAALLIALLAMQRTTEPPSPPLLLTVDLKALLAEQARLLAAQPQDPRDRHSHARDFAHALETELDALSREHAAVILNRAAVVRGASDVTPLLRARLQALPSRPGSSPAVGEPATLSVPASRPFPPDARRAPGGTP